MLLKMRMMRTARSPTRATRTTKKTWRIGGKATNLPLEKEKKRLPPHIRIIHPTACTSRSVGQVDGAREIRLVAEMIPQKGGDNLGKEV